MVKLGSWERGFYVESQKQPDMRAFFWFYEWHMFEAVCSGQHTGGRYNFPWSVTDEEAVTDEDGFRVEAQAVEDGATLSLRITNRSDHDWPEMAGIIPCFNPGPEHMRTETLVDEDHTRTFFLGSDGLERLEQREIHFNDRLWSAVDPLSEDGTFVFSHKWPPTDRNAQGGVIVREAAEGNWVAGIAWEDFLSAQGHNPWYCMHLSVCVGPLKQGESTTVKGRIYLFEGDGEACLEKYKRDFG